MSELSRVSPESLGISSENFEKFYQELAINKLPIHNFIFMRHGKVATLGSWYPYTKEMNHIMYSTSKSLTSLAIGFCMEDGLLSLDDKIVSFFPELITGPLHEFNQMRTIRNLLMMAGGETGDATSIDRSYPNWLKTYLNTPPRVKPGTLYGYDSAGTHTLSAVVQKVTGIKMVDYLQDKLFKPLNIEHVYWEEQMGINTGSRGFHCKIEDIVKIALLIHQKGMWEGRRLISEKWLEEAIKKQIEVTNFTSFVDGNPGYGYQFWRYRDGSYGSKGHGGQMFIIYPRYDVIWAFQANLEDQFGRLSEFIHIAWNVLFENISESPLPENPAAYHRLLQAEKNLQFPLPEEMEDRSRKEDWINGNKYVITKNEAQIHDLIINKTGKGLEFTFTLGADSHTWQFEAYNQEWNDQYISVTDDQGWARYLWRNENLLECVILLKEKLGSYRIIIYVDDDNSIGIDMYPVGWRDFNRIKVFGMGYCHEI